MCCDITENCLKYELLGINITWCMCMCVCKRERERERKNLIKLLTENMPAGLLTFNVENVTTLWVGKDLLWHTAVYYI